MARMLLDNVGLSLAVAMLWFFGMPILVQRSRGGGVVVRVRPNLTIGALILFVVSMIVAFSVDFSEPKPLFAWHVMSLSVCFMAAYAITTWLPRTFASELVEVLRPAAALPLLVIFGAFISHGIHALGLFPQAFGPPK